MKVLHEFIPYKGRRRRPVMPLFPGRDLPGGCGCSACAAPTGDGSGAGVRSELERPDEADYEALVERLKRALAVVATRDHYRAWMTGDEEEGHPFHGNQYTGGLGAKPTETKVTGVKSGVHELLSSGHGFTMEELQKATGAKTLKQISDALAMLKNPKYAGSKGVLSIEKKGSEYFVAKGGEPVAPPAPEPAKTAADPDPEPEWEPSMEEVGKPKIAPTKETAMPPPAPMPKDQADKVYAEAMKTALSQAKMMADVAEGDVAWKIAAQYYKDLKAAQMAQWKANTTGTPVKPKPQEVFAADLQLVGDLKAGVDPEKAQADWKTNTSKEKAGTWPPGKVAAKQAALAEQQKAEQAGQSAKLKAQQEANKAAAAEAAKNAQPPLFQPVADYVPADHKHLDAKEFTDGTFTKNLNKLKSVLQTGHEDKKGNKIAIQAALTERLKDSKPFQEVSAFFKKKGGNYGGSLEANLISTWASTSADTHPVSIANQMAVREAFEMDADDVAVGAASSHLKSQDDTVYHQAANQLGYPINSPAQLSTFKAALRDFALAQYHNTQEHLAAKGIEHVYVARGMKTTEGVSDKAEIDTVKMQPVSSFSANYSTAHGFSGGYGSVYFVKVPRSQVFSSYVTGFGCTNEHEVCVLAHPSMTAVKMKASGKGNVHTAVEHAAQTLSMPDHVKAEIETSTSKAAAAKAKKEAKTAHWYKPPLKPATAKVGGFAKNAYTAAKNNNLAGLLQIQEQMQASGMNQTTTTPKYVNKLVEEMKAHHESPAYKAGAAPKPKAEKTFSQYKAEVTAPKTAAGVPEYPGSNKTGLSPSQWAAAHANHAGGFVAPLPAQPPKVPTAGTFAHAAKFAPPSIANHPHFSPEKYEQWLNAGLTDFQVGKKLAMEKFKAKQKAMAQHVLGA